MLQIEYEKEYEKLDRMCQENDLDFNFENSRFPIVAKITPSFEMKNQMTLNVGGPDSNFVNGEIQLMFGESLQMKVLNDFSIDDNLLNRIKRSSKNLHYIFLQQYFKETMQMKRGEE